MGTEIKTYTQIDMMRQEQAIEYKNICDMFLSVLATVENIVSLPIDEKKYGYYDEYNSKKYKTYNGLMLQLLRILKNMKENKEDFESEYNIPFQFPKNIDLNVVNQKIIYWKSLNKNKDFQLYLDEINNIINGKSKLDLEDFKAQYYSKKPVTDAEKINRLNNILSVKIDNSKEDQKVIEEIEKTGKYTYKPVYDAMSGRLERDKENGEIKYGTDCDLDFTNNDER